LDAPNVDTDEDAENAKLYAKLMKGDDSPKFVSDYEVPILSWVAPIG
jgi:hypothetical protein